MDKAVFIDRDGTINEESGYLYRFEECRFIPGVFDALRLFNSAGYRVIVVTNQSGIARGYYTEDDMRLLHGFITAAALQEGAVIEGWYHCPHHPDYPQQERSCECRKPQPGMLLQAAADFSIDLSRSWMIGDKLADVEAGISAGCSSILVRTGYGAAEETLVKPGIPVVDNLFAAAEYITGRNYYI